MTGGDAEDDALGSSPERIDELAQDLTALSNPLRVRLLHLLTTPRYSEEIAEALGRTRQAATRHIEQLEARGFIEPMEGWRETGPVREYQVVPKRLFALGMTVADLGRLEPEGGPDVQRHDRTVQIPEDMQGESEGPREDVEPVRSARLLLANGPEAGLVIDLDDEGPRWTLGRDEDRTLALTWDPYVSARHAEVQVDPRGHVLVDVNSFNGTILNFSTIPQGERVLLRPGDLLKLGHTLLVYQRAEG